MSEQSEPIQPSKPVKDFVMYNKVKIFKGTPEYEAHLKKQKAWRDQWNKDNPEKRKKIHKDAWKNNKERRVQSMYKWREKKKDSLLEYRRNWWSKNRDRLSDERKEAYADPSTGMRAAIKSRGRERKARKLRNGIGDTAVITAWIRRWEILDSVICYWCLNDCNPDDCHADHIVALNNGGPHSIENLCIACSFCNHSKGHKQLHDWNKRLKQPVLEWQNNFI